MSGTAEELEARRVALEETREDRAYELRRRELAIEERKAGREGARTLIVGLVSAVIGAVASLGAAYLAGAFDIQGRRIEGRAAADLEQQRFRFELINWALAEEDDQARAQRLRFMVEVGLPERLDRDAILRYAEREEQRLRTGSDEPSLIPRTEINPAAQMQFDPLAANRIGVAVSQVLSDEYRVLLDDPGRDRRAVAEAIGEITGLGRAEVAQMVGKSGVVVVSGLTREEAYGVRDRLIAAGAKSRIEQMAPIRTMR